QYEFVEGVREVLWRSVRLTEIEAVLDAVSKYICQKAGISIKSFPALLFPNSGLDEKTKAEIFPFAEFNKDVLRQLGGDYATLAEQLNPVEVIHELPLPEIKTFEFEFAIITEDETSINLEPFDFEVALIEINKPNQLNSKNLIEIVDEAIFNKTGNHLGKTQKVILEGTLANLNYKDIAAPGNYDEKTVKLTAYKLWKFLTKIIGTKVTKTNFKNVINQWIARSQLIINRHPGQAQQFTEDLGNGIKLEMVSIPGGTFMMGSQEEEEGSSNNERPQHEVTINPFCMGKYPITQAQWQAVAALPQVNQELNPDPSEFKGANRPIECVSWYDAVEFCARLSAYTQRHYKLPSEAQWEYACRAVTTTPFHFGETITTDLANYNGQYTYGNSFKGINIGETTEVGHFKVANEFGLYDMHGNVSEWCDDNWHDNYINAPVNGNSWVKKQNNTAVLRGGSCGVIPQVCRSASRTYFNPAIEDLFSLNIGFRVVCTATL
ncbi:MAG: SUMF1/EgtB/PvdO family nonheme iron enzyme, partial [Dolichospermum sp.]